MDTTTAKRNHEFFCGAEIVFECSEGFRMVGSNSLRCLETGSWSNEMPICEYTPESEYIGNNKRTYLIVCLLTAVKYIRTYARTQ